MLDPFAPPAWIRSAVEPLTHTLHLHTLTLHLHELLFSYAVYVLINSFLAPYVSARLLATTYAQFSSRTKLQWNLHVTSFVNAVFLSISIPYILYADRDRLNSTWEERLWGYTGAGGLVQALGAGYFLWDVQVCFTNVATLGVLDLLHAVVGLCISILGFVCPKLKLLPCLRSANKHTQRPFGLYYGIQYGLVELSTPFVNIHWFLNKTGYAGSKTQIANGVVLIITFACCRLLWGSYMTFTFFSDVWTALHASKPSWTEYNYAAGERPLLLQHEAVWWVGAAFMCTHIVVMSLSTFWFVKMIATMRKHIISIREDKKTQ
jgi:hypothetical protein